MSYCNRKGVECECLSENSVCNSDNCHRKLPDKLTDNEIVKALNTALGMEHISIYCVNIKNEVHTVKVLDIIDLINRLQAENERLNEEKNTMSAYIKGNGWGLISFVEFVKNAKAEAVTEFAERLKNENFKINYCGSVYNVIDVDDIDNLLKEMVGEDKL